MMMKKLLQICVEGNSGTTGKIADEIGALAIENGWKSYIAFGRYPRPSTSTLIKIGSSYQILLHGVQTRILDRHCLGSKKATQKLIEEIDKIQPSIIHLHHLHGYYLNIKILFKYLSKVSIPIVWTFHDCWSITGHCTHFDSIGCSKWKTECNHCPQKKEYPSSIFIDRSRKNYYLKKTLFTSVNNLMIVSVSKWLDSIIANSFMSHLQRTVIYNGVDINVFAPKTCTEEIRQRHCINKKFMILGVANPWRTKKGYDDFIELSKLIKKDEIIVLVGLDKTQLKDLPFNIIGLPRIECKEELIDLYAAADLFMNLSVEETFGLTTAEALSCGTPVVVYNSTACPEIVDSQTGFIVEKGDFSGLLQAIITVKTNRKEFYSKACRQRILTHFNKDDRYMEYLALYNNLIRD